MPRQVKDHGGISSDEWCSPPEIGDPLYELYGRPIGTDPCSNERSVIRSVRRFTSGGLVLPWATDDLEDAFSNWPYSQNDVWAPKAIYELKLGMLAELVILCMTASSTRWWRDLMTKPRRNPRVIMTKRLKFLGPGGKPVDSSRFEPALIYYGKKSERFDRMFKHVTMWSTWGR